MGGDIPALIRGFLTGKMDIFTFRQLYDTQPEINDFLQSVIDSYVKGGRPLMPVPHQLEDGTATIHKGVTYFAEPENYPGFSYGICPFYCVRDYLTEKCHAITTDVRSASGAWKFYTRVYDIFYQYDRTVPCCDQAYERAFSFALDVIPNYLCGGEAELYIQENIIPMFPESMPKIQRKKAIRAKIKEEFRSVKGYPAWIQSSEWPLGKDGKPTVYLGRKSKCGGEMSQYLFRDESDDSTIIVEQFY